MIFFFLERDHAGGRCADGQNTAEVGKLGEFNVTSYVFIRLKSEVG